MQPSESFDSPNANNSESKTEQKQKRNHLPGFAVMLLWLLRLVLGCVFVFSGFVKAVDPWGGLYKITDYFNAWGISLTHETGLILACLLSGFEFVLGILIILGLFRKGASWLALLFMMFMTLMTLYVWIEDPVSDCGCFGEALIISNSMTFWKNVILLICTLLFFKYNRKIPSLINRHLQWLALLFSCLYIISIQAYGYNVQPLIDFRPYPIGLDLYALQADTSNDGLDNFYFVYEKDGVRKSFNGDELPDDSWTFIERTEKKVTAGRIGLTIFDELGDDVSEDIFANNSDQLILIVSNPDRYGLARSSFVNNLYEQSLRIGYDMFAIIAANPDDIENWKKYTSAKYPVYSADDTELKMLVRGDGAIVTFHNGKIGLKTNIFAISPDYNTAGEASDIFASQNDKSILLIFTLIWLTLMIVLYIASRYIYHLRNPRKQQLLVPVPSDSNKTGV